MFACQHSIYDLVRQQVMAFSDDSLMKLLAFWYHLNELLYGHTWVISSVISYFNILTCDIDRQIFDRNNSPFQMEFFFFFLLAESVLNPAVIQFDTYAYWYWFTM